MPTPKLTWCLLLMSSISLLTSCSDAPSQAQRAEITTDVDAFESKVEQDENNDGYVFLFDGKTSNGWRGFNRSDFPSNWVIDDGALHMVGEKNMTDAQKQDRADIVFDQTFENFILKLEWKISVAGNSGIFYLGEESDQYEYIWMTAPEMQVLDNDAHPDAQAGKNGNRQAGSLYDLVPAVPQNAKAVGEWNQVEIHVDNRKVKHIQNGEVVVEFEMDTDQWFEMIAGSKFPSLNENWHRVPQKGLIGLQDHSDPVWFRNIRIKTL